MNKIPKSNAERIVLLSLNREVEAMSVTMQIKNSDIGIQRQKEINL